MRDMSVAKKKAKPPTNYEVLQGLTNVDPDDPGSATEYALLTLLEHLDHMLEVRGGLVVLVEHTNRRCADDFAWKHSLVLDDVWCELVGVNDAGEPADDEVERNESQLAVALAYYEHALETKNAPQEFRTWLRTTLEMDDAAATEDEPLSAEEDEYDMRSPEQKAAEDGPASTPPWEDAPAPAKKPKKAKKAPVDPDALPDLTGLPSKFRQGKTWVVGSVVEGTGALVVFRDNYGKTYPDIDRSLVKVLKKAAGLGAATEVVAPVSNLPPIVVLVPKATAKKYAKLDDNEGKDKFEVLWKIQVPIAENRWVNVEVTAGDDDETPYVDIYTTVPLDNGGQGIDFEHAPLDHLLGTYQIRSGGEDRVLEVKSA